MLKKTLFVIIFVFFCLLGYFRWIKDSLVEILGAHQCWNFEWCERIKIFLQDDEQVFSDQISEKNGIFGEIQEKSDGSKRISAICLQGEGEAQSGKEEKSTGNGEFIALNNEGFTEDQSGKEGKSTGSGEFIALNNEEFMEDQSGKEEKSKGSGEFIVLNKEEFTEDQKLEYDFSLVNLKSGEYYDFVVKYFQLSKYPEEFENFKKLPRGFFDFENKDDIFMDEEENLFKNKTNIGNWELEMEDGDSYKILNKTLGISFVLHHYFGYSLSFYVTNDTYECELIPSDYGPVWGDYRISQKFDVPQTMTFFGEDYILDLGKQKSENPRVLYKYDYIYSIYGGYTFFYNFTSPREAEDFVTAYIQATEDIKPVYGITFEKYPGMVFKYTHKTAKNEAITKDGSRYPLISLLAIVPDSLTIHTDEGGAITDLALLEGLIDIVGIGDMIGHEYKYDEEGNVLLPLSLSQYQQFLKKIDNSMCKIGACKGAWIYSAYGKKFEGYAHSYEDRNTKPLFVLKPSKIPGYRILSIADDIEVCIGSAQDPSCYGFVE